MNTCLFRCVAYIYSCFSILIHYSPGKIMKEAAYKIIITGVKLLIIEMLLPPNALWSIKFLHLISPTQKKILGIKICILCLFKRKHGHKVLATQDWISGLGIWATPMSLRNKAFLFCFLFHFFSFGLLFVFFYLELPRSGIYMIYICIYISSLC